MTITRRTPLAGAAGCGLLTACSASADSDNASKREQRPATSGPWSVPIAEVPVGGSVVVMVDAIYPVVVTRPTRTTFAAHTAICTHQGCRTAPAQHLELQCPCHGSRFDAATGKVLAGPATRALRAWPFTHNGDVIVLHAHEDSWDDGGSGNGSPDG